MIYVVIGDSITNMFMNGLPFMTFSTTEIDLLMIKSERFIWLRISVGDCTKFIGEWKISDKETALANQESNAKEFFHILSQLVVVT